MIKKILNIYRYITEHIIANNENCAKFLNPKEINKNFTNEELEEYLEKYKN